jgi:hypothetical protein
MSSRKRRRCQLRQRLPTSRSLDIFTQDHMRNRSREEYREIDVDDAPDVFHFFRRILRCVGTQDSRYSCGPPR